MVILQLNPPLEVWVPEKGHGWALCLLDYGPGLNGCFLVVLETNNRFLYVDVTLCTGAGNPAYSFNQKPNL